MAGESGKNRKYGRKARSPAQKAYNNTKRWEKNAAKRIAKEAKRQATPKIMLIARGTARALRRAKLQRAA